MFGSRLPLVCPTSITAAASPASSSSSVSAACSLCAACCLQPTRLVVMCWIRSFQAPAAAPRSVCGSGSSQIHQKWFLSVHYSLCVSDVFLPVHYAGNHPSHSAAASIELKGLEKEEPVWVCINICINICIRTIQTGIKAVFCWIILDDILHLYIQT